MTIRELSGPIDAACQTAAYRPDLLEQAGEVLPRTLPQMLDHAPRRPIALALGVPHAFMNHLSLCGLMDAGTGGWPARPNGSHR